MRYKIKYEGEMIICAASKEEAEGFFLDAVESFENVANIYNASIENAYHEVTAASDGQ